MPRTTQDATYWIEHPLQIECLASSRRHAILDRLAAAGPLAVREFAADVGLKAPAAYHHLRRLMAVGLVVESGSRVVNRRVERLYAAVAPRMRLSRALADPAHAAGMRNVVASLCRQADRDFAAAVESPDTVAAGPRRNLGFSRHVGTPGPETLKKINKHLDAISELLWNEREDDAPLISLAWTLAPVGPPPGSIADDD